MENEDFESNTQDPEDFYTQYREYSDWLFSDDQLVDDIVPDRDSYKE